MPRDSSRGNGKQMLNDLYSSIKYFQKMQPSKFKLLKSMVIILALSFWGCKKHTYSACFNTDKSSISVGDSVILTNCSNFDGGYTECLWDFGDGKSEYSKGTAVIKHPYNTPGQFEIKLTIGEKENNSEFIKTVIVQ